jgi:ryanodine receptor 2
VYFKDQLRRYNEIKQSDLPSAVAAKKTREFRCPPREQVKTTRIVVIRLIPIITCIIFLPQMNAILGFKNLVNDDKENCLIGDDLRERMNEFNEKLMKQISLVALQESEDDVIYY